MRNMLTFFKRLLTEDKGQGLTEYALIITLVAVALVVAVLAFRTQIIAMFNNAVTALQTP